MKTLTVSKIANLAKCSESTARNICYGYLFENGKIYTNRGNNARTTINYLTKNFGVEFTTGNDAPKGGKIGNYVIITKSTPSYEAFKRMLIDADNEATQQEIDRKNERMSQINSIQFTNEEILKLKSKIEGVSNSQARKIAHNFSAKKLGFYSNDGMLKALSLVNNS